MNVFLYITSYFIIFFSFQCTYNKMSDIDSEAVAVIVWENELPENFDFEYDMEKIINKYCSEMNEKYTLSGRYTSKQGHQKKLVLINDIICLSVQRNHVIIDIPTDFLDVKILINIIDRKYGEICK